MKVTKIYVERSRDWAVAAPMLPSSKTSTHISRLSTHSQCTCYSHGPSYHHLSLWLLQQPLNSPLILLLIPYTLFSTLFSEQSFYNVQQIFPFIFLLKTLQWLTTAFGIKSKFLTTASKVLCDLVLACLANCSLLTHSSYHSFCCVNVSNSFLP